MTELGFDFWYTLILLVGMTVLLTTEKLEVEVTVLGTLFLMLLGGVMDTADAFSGFANEGVITIAAMFVVAGALNTTGILRNVSHHLFGRKKNSVAAKLSRLLLPVGALSAFVNNTPVVALLIPVVRNWAEKYGYPVSKFLMPISFAAILGGMCTLIGTSTNLIINGWLVAGGHHAGLGIF
ncbi:MAG: SLC13 family permease, partial [Calditrichaeota bacterium]|nr:SLC13 family permease [Calditrichota bacterium]